MAVRRSAQIFLMAGEPSGDAIGARLMAALRRESGDSRELRFAGVGGPRMAAEGLESLFPMDDLGVMGFAEVVPALPRLCVRLVQTICAVRRTAPDVVVGIDSKAFSLRVLGSLAALRRRESSAGPASPALVQYVAPSAWAFADAPRRAQRLAGVVDELLVLLPFEAPLYSAAGVPCTFVGHPALDDFEGAAAASRPGSVIAGAVVGAAAGEGPGALCVLPGSRRQEVDSNLPHMLQAAQWVADAQPPAPQRGGGPEGSGGIERLLVPTTASTRALVEAHLGARGPGALPATVVDADERYAAYAASRLAIACCGTVNTELALAGTPQVAVYRSSAATSWLVRHILQPSVPYATLPNLLNWHAMLRDTSRLDPTAAASEAAAPALSSPTVPFPAVAPPLPPLDGAIPELLFEDCTPRSVADAALHLLQSPAAAQAQVAAARRAVARLTPEAERARAGEPAEPSARPSSAAAAARAVLRHLPLREPSVI